MNNGQTMENKLIESQKNTPIERHNTLIERHNTLIERHKPYLGTSYCDDHKALI